MTNSWLRTTCMTQTALHYVSRAVWPLCCRSVSNTEFNVTSFCREVGPLSYSRLKVLRLDGNQMSYQKLPPDWVFCLRVLESIYIWRLVSATCNKNGSAVCQNACVWLSITQHSPTQSHSGQSLQQWLNKGFLARDNYTVTLPIN